MKSLDRARAKLKRLVKGEAHAPIDYRHSNALQARGSQPEALNLAKPLKSTGTTPRSLYKRLTTIIKSSLIANGAATPDSSTHEVLNSKTTPTCNTPETMNMSTPSHPKKIQTKKAVMSEKAALLLGLPRQAYITSSGAAFAVPQATSQKAVGSSIPVGNKSSTEHSDRTLFDPRSSHAARYGITDEQSDLVKAPLLPQVPFSARQSIFLKSGVSSLPMDFLDHETTSPSRNPSRRVHQASD